MTPAESKWNEARSTGGITPGAKRRGVMSLGFYPEGHSAEA